MWVSKMALTSTRKKSGPGFNETWESCPGQDQLVITKMSDRIAQTLSHLIPNIYLKIFKNAYKPLPSTASLELFGYKLISIFPTTCPGARCHLTSHNSPWTLSASCNWSHWESSLQFPADQCNLLSFITASLK